MSRGPNILFEGKELPTHVVTEAGCRKDVSVPVALPDDITLTKLLCSTRVPFSVGAYDAQCTADRCHDSGHAVKPVFLRPFLPRSRKMVGSFRAQKIQISRDYIGLTENVTGH